MADKRANKSNRRNLGFFFGEAVVVVVAMVMEECEGVVGFETVAATMVDMIKLRSFWSINPIVRWMVTFDFFFFLFRRWRLSRHAVLGGWLLLWARPR